MYATQSRITAAIWLMKASCWLFSLSPAQLQTQTYAYEIFIYTMAESIYNIEEEMRLYISCMMQGVLDDVSGD
jgi:hypothetical protein